MIILGIFLILSLIELGVIYFYWSKVTDNVLVEITTEIGGEMVTQAPMKYKRLPLRIVAKLKSYKKLLWIPVGIIMFVNFAISLILGGLATIIIGIINI